MRGYQTDDMPETSWGKTNKGSRGISMNGTTLSFEEILGVQKAHVLEQKRRGDQVIDQICIVVDDLLTLMCCSEAPTRRLRRGCAGVGIVP